MLQTIGFKEQDSTLSGSNGLRVWIVVMSFMLQGLKFECLFFIESDVESFFIGKCNNNNALHCDFQCNPNLTFYLLNPFFFFPWLLSLIY